jgi:hypothetical protein
MQSYLWRKLKQPQNLPPNLLTSKGQAKRLFVGILVIRSRMYLEKWYITAPLNHFYCVEHLPSHPFNINHCSFPHPEKLISF